MRLHLTPPSNGQIKGPYYPKIDIRTASDRSYERAISKPSAAVFRVDIALSEYRPGIAVSFICGVFVAARASRNPEMPVPKGSRLP
ncbi:unnamed protein product, partial [Iphiclides podalirius]